LDYGTLRVTTPDGQVREYPIDVPSAIIGRAEGNRVMVDHVSVSRRHARLGFANGQPMLEDLSSATGTYVSGERLQPGTPRPIQPGEQLRIGDCQAVLLASAVAPTPDAGPGPGPGGRWVQPGPTDQVTAVWLAAPNTPVAPGSAVSATVTVQNRGDVADTVTLSVQGIPEHWVRITRSSLQLVPDARDEVAFVIQPPRDPSSRAGEY
jgi:eukaryotic-like serine/threonine-protein kinase